MNANLISLLGIGPTVKAIAEFFMYRKASVLERESKARQEAAEAARKELEVVETLLNLVRKYQACIDAHQIDNRALIRHIRTIDDQIKRGNIIDVLVKAADKPDSSSSENAAE